MEDYSSTSFIQAFIRFACEVGFPKFVLLDEGSQLIKGCESMKINYQDIKHRLHFNHGINFETCPVGGHHMHGKVERKIKEVKISIEKKLQNERLSILQWETLASQISNTVNDMPLALNNVVGDFECMDLPTPNRLKLGRNNDRSPIGEAVVVSNCNKVLQENQKIFQACFETWLLVHVPKLIEQPKWFHNDQDLKVGDIVLFLKQDNAISSNYQYGMVQSVERGSDGKIRKAIVRYHNNSEDVDRTTNRAVRQLIMIHPVDETDLVKNFGEISSFADLRLKIDQMNKIK